MKNKIKKLPIEFIGKGEVKGFNFRQLVRGQKACLYEVNTQCSNHFEVFKIRVFHLPKSTDLYESYPKANSFAVWAWIYNQFYDLYKKLIKQEFMIKNKINFEFHGSE